MRRAIAELADNFGASHKLSEFGKLLLKRDLDELLFVNTKADDDDDDDDDAGEIDESSAPVNDDDDDDEATTTTTTTSTKKQTSIVKMKSSDKYTSCLAEVQQVVNDVVNLFTPTFDVPMSKPPKSSSSSSSSSSKKRKTMTVTQCVVLAFVLAAKAAVNGVVCLSQSRFYV